MHTFTLILEFNDSVLDIFQTSKCLSSGRLVYEVFGISFMRPYNQSGRWQDMHYIYYHNGMFRIKIKYLTLFQRHNSILAYILALSPREAKATPLP